MKKSNTQQASDFKEMAFAKLLSSEDGLIKVSADSVNSDQPEYNFEKIKNDIIIHLARLTVARLHND